MSQNIYKVNVLLADVSAPDEDGYLYYGPMGVAANGEVAEYAEKIIVQVNKFQPRVSGRLHRIHVSQVTCLCESDHELPELPQPEVSDVERKIADLNALRSELDRMLSQCSSGTVGDCRIIESLSPSHENMT